MTDGTAAPPPPEKGAGGSDKKTKANRSAISCLLLILCLLGGCRGVVWLMNRPETPTIRLHDAQVDWLPASASDVSIYRTEGFGWIRATECALPAADLETLAARRGWNMQPAKARDARCFAFAHELLGLPPPGEIGEALSHEERANNGGGIIAVYDLDRQRLCVVENHR